MLADQTTRSGQSSTTRDGREREAKEAFDGALLLRDQALPLLRAVVAGDHDLSAEVESAVGTADSPENLAAATKRLASVGERVLGMKRGPFTARARLMQLDTEYLDKLSAAATRLEGAAEKARARSGGLRVTQGALDREDGANLRILGHIIDVFEAAHDLDPTIPRLAPIATRRLLGRTRKAAKDPQGDTATMKDASGAEPAKAPAQASKTTDTSSPAQPA